MSGNPNSILDTVKKMHGIDPSDSSFDLDLIAHTNSVLAILRQLGVGLASGFAITDNTQLWSDFTPDIVKLAPIKSYTIRKIQLWFDPPQNARILDAIEKQVLELEERIMMIAEEITPPTNPLPPPTDSLDEDSDNIIEGYFFGSDADL